MLSKSVAAGALAFAGAVSAQSDPQPEVQSRWGQCAGDDYDGPVACPTGFLCEYGNQWYSQCVLPEVVEEVENPEFTWVPDEPIDTETRLTTITLIEGPAPTVVTTYITFLTPHPTESADGWATATSQQQPSETVWDGNTFTLVPDTPVTPRVKPRVMTAAPVGMERRAVAKKEEKREEKRQIPNVVAPRAVGPVVAAAVAPAAPVKMEKRTDSPRTLEDGQYWIRSVVDPNYHKYMQSGPENSVGPAIMESHETAGQFSIVDGQLVGLVPSEDVEDVVGGPLYLNVEHPEDLTQRKLATWFNTTMNEFGTFEWSGDALTWSHPDVQRQNLAAWLVCEDQEAFINTGAYAYQTPEGCADQTIHYYNGATANL